MFWHLVLAHFAADYLLQPDWMARNKQRRVVLTGHILVYFLTMLVVTWPGALAVWPLLAALSLAHLLLDFIKSRIQKRWPENGVGLYLVDQFLHLASIYLFALIIGRFPHPALLVSNQLAVYALAYLLATRVWAITERILFPPKASESIHSNPWPRMLSRAGMLSVLLLTWNLFGSRDLIGLAWVIPYTIGQGGKQALLTDFSVASSAAILAVLAG